MTITFTGSAIEWRGPAPYLFVPMPDDVSAELAALGSKVSYGWGCIPAKCTCDTQCWDTALMPRKGIYLVPIKAVIQRACKLDIDSIITITVDIEINAD